MGHSENAEEHRTVHLGELDGQPVLPVREMEYTFRHTTESQLRTYTLVHIKNENMRLLTYSRDSIFPKSLKEPMRSRVVLLGRKRYISRHDTFDTIKLT